jgi:multisubunit Na+/H+ antiporter MnhB subunit
MFLLIEGVLLAFMVQLLYDILREEPMYQNLLPMRYLRPILAIVVGIIVIWILTKFSEEKPS